MESLETAEPAILVRQVCKQYAGQKDNKIVLDHVNMTVNKGTIYALLGASGCGKTTLLSAIVGGRKFKSGTISVLGKRPGSTSAIKSIGYMPQDIALVGEFTIKEVMQHFGWIFGMTNQQIEERFVFLEKLFDLPPSKTLIKNLSGGQKRRVSMAVVLIHDPSVLILDEPTVGLDPVLRQNIWDYLMKITVEEKKTVIITTHYIEEARQAHNVGLMRHGEIIAEGNTQDLLNKYNCTSLENVFLQLSIQQKEDNISRSKRVTQVTSTTEEENKPVVDESLPKKTLWEKTWFTNRGHAKALVTKNLIRYVRHPGTLLFAFGFPILQLSMYFLVIGSTPPDLAIGVFNEELGNFTNCEQFGKSVKIGGTLQEDNITCTYEGLGCAFIGHLGDKIIKNKKYYKIRDEAIMAVKRGEVHTLVTFTRNYSQAVTTIRNGEFDDIDLEFQQISIYQEEKDFALSVVIEKEIYDTFKRFNERLAEDCKIKPRAERVPIFFNDPVYGSDDLTYRDFSAPGMIIIMAALLAVGVSSLTIITERTEGIWERTLVAGITEAEILIFHTVVLCAVTTFQVIEVLVIAFYMFQQTCVGYKAVVFFLIYFQVVCAVCLGILISVITKTVTAASYISLGLLYPFVTLSGTIWPLEAVPTFLRFISYMVPVTLPIESINYVFYRGWGVERFEVLKSFFSSIGFSLLYLAISMFSLRKEKL